MDSGDERSTDAEVENGSEHETQERNAGVAIAVLALLVLLLFVAIITGATDAYQP